MSKQVIEFEPQRDWPILLLLLPSLAVPSFLLVTQSDADENAKWVFILIAILPVAIAMLAATTLSYRVENNQLVLSMLGWPKRIGLNAITEIAPSRTLIWPPARKIAFSLELIELHYSKGKRECRVQIAPAQIPHFVRIMKERCPNLVVSLPGYRA